MNPVYHISRMRELVDEFEPSRERSLAATKLDEFEMWLSRCTPTDEALGRDLRAPSALTCNMGHPIGANGMHMVSQDADKHD
jgi:hypothetical protein